MSYEIDIELTSVDVRVEYEFTKGKPAIYSEAHGNYLPGEPDEISNVQAFAQVSFKTLLEALWRAVKARTVQHKDMVEINLYEVLSESEQLELLSKCHQDATDNDGLEF